MVYIKDIFRRSLRFFLQDIALYIRSIYLYKYLNYLSRGEVLDAGCGRGNVALYLAQRYPEAKINAYDLSQENIAVCKKAQKKLKIKNIKFIRKDLLSLDEHDQYDFVYCLDVLEHIEGNERVIKAIHAALKEGGRFYVHMPVKELKSIFNKKYYRNFEKWVTEEHIGEHYTMEELKQFLQELGLRIMTARRTFGFFGMLAWEIDYLLSIHYFLKILKAIFRPLCWGLGRLDTILENKWGNCFLILAEKRALDRHRREFNFQDK